MDSILKQTNKTVGLSAKEMTWATAANHYLTYLEVQNKIKRTKRATINYLLNQPIANLKLSDITSEVIADYLKHRIAKDKVKPQTVNNDFAYICSVMKHASSVLNTPVDLEVLTEAKKMASENNLIGKSKRRERRLSLKEEATLLDYFGEDKFKHYMVDVIKFALYSSRSQSEITRLRWSDLDEAEFTIKIRDLKKTYLSDNIKIAKLTKKALEVILRQPRTNEFIFPLNHKTISTNFTRACKLLEINDLRFHDLRHEATSRLFEAGHSIIEVHHFTLHEDWATLTRYAHAKSDNTELKG